MAMPKYAIDFAGADTSMTKDEILATLKSAESQLRAKGVRRAALFGVAGAR